MFSNHGLLCKDNEKYIPATTKYVTIASPQKVQEKRFCVLTFKPVHQYRWLLFNKTVTRKLLLQSCPY